VLGDVLGAVVHALVAQVAHVDEPVDAAEIDEGAEVHDLADRALDVCPP
jgi:hypothetical protein